MKRAMSYSNSTCATIVTILSRQEPRRRPAQPGEALRESLCVADAALEPAEARRRAHLLDDVDAVVVAQPRELALVRLEHRRLGVDRVRDVDVLRRVEADAHQGVHPVDRRDL